MKVFLSWSESQSHKVALVFREWLPSVIQKIEPYVSSEDIDKGARWSTDIAKELSDSKFGILCVTKENINSPWLMFEAGALSKTIEKAYVSPFLFDIKRSEVDGPILQFQSTIFEKEDLKKLVVTLNKACGNDGLTDERLNEAFEIWYPPLKNNLEQLRDKGSTKQEVDGTTKLQAPKTQEVLEEILELSRINQKLMRNPDGALGASLEEINNRLHALHERTEKSGDFRRMRRTRELHPMMLDELMRMFPAERDNYVGIQMALGLLKAEYPWIYDVGIETIGILQSRRQIDEKRRAIEQFRRIMDFLINHPMMHEIYGLNEDFRYFCDRLQEMLVYAFEHNQIHHSN